jgi:hypothetical protein
MARSPGDLCQEQGIEFGRNLAQEPLTIGLPGLTLSFPVEAMMPVCLTPFRVGLRV